MCKETIKGQPRADAAHQPGAYRWEAYASVRQCRSRDLSKGSAESDVSNSAGDGRDPTARLALTVLKSAAISATFSLVAVLDLVHQISDWCRGAAA